jgi:hypothetical protein
MKPLLTISAVFEGTTGMALLAVPALAVSILLGAPLDALGLAVARVAGAALVALGIACWGARQDGSSRTATGVVAAMLFYNAAAAVALAYAGFVQGLGSLALWPIAVLHVVMAGWCLAYTAGGSHLKK